LRWGSIGIRHWHDGVNIAEGAVLLVSIIDIGAQFSGVTRGSPLASLRVVRAFRVLRLSFISSAWVKVLRRIGRAVPFALSASLLSFVFTIIFAGKRSVYFAGAPIVLPLPIVRIAAVVGMQVRVAWPVCGALLGYR